MLIGNDKGKSSVGFPMEMTKKAKVGYKLR